MKILIAGNGIAGSTAARFIRKLSQHEVTMVSDESEVPFSRTALMYLYMGHVRFEDTKLYEDGFWKKNRIGLVRGAIMSVDTAGKQVLLSNGRQLSYDILIIATGSRPNKFGWKGQELEGVRGLYHLQDLEYLAKRSASIQRAIITGGGLIGIELAEMLHSRRIPVTMLVREDSFWNNVLPPEESAMINRHIRSHGIDLRLSTELSEITDRGDGQASGVITTAGEHISGEFVGLTVGVSPNIDFIRNSAIETDKGVLVNSFLETSVSGVYAIGDCAQLRSPDPGRRPVEAVWYTGRIMGQAVAHTICGRSSEYHPGIWFNSAKFFDIEYAVYGQIAPRPDDKTGNIYWEHPDGNRSIRIAYDIEKRYVKGFNLMGIRYRHEVCEKWLRDKAPVSEVLSALSMANFDPEFFDTFEKEVLKSAIHQGIKIQMQ